MRAARQTLIFVDGRHHGVRSRETDTPPTPAPAVFWALCLVATLAPACVAPPAAASRIAGPRHMEDHHPLRASDVRGLWTLLAANPPSESWSSPLAQVLAATPLDTMLAVVLDPDGARLPHDAFTPAGGIARPLLQQAAAVGDPDRAGPGVPGPVHLRNAAPTHHMQVFLQASVIVFIAAILLLPLGCAATSRRLYPPPVAPERVSVPRPTPPPPTPVWPTEWPPQLTLETRREPAPAACPQFPADGALVFPPQALSVFSSGREKPGSWLIPEAFS